MAYLATPTSEVTLPPEIVDLIRDFGGFDALGGPLTGFIEQKAQGMHFRAYSIDTASPAGEGSRADGDWEPWHKEAKDTGCSLYEKCLSCPLPQCMEDVGYWAAAKAGIAAGVAFNVPPHLANTVNEMAAQAGVHRSTVMRHNREAGIPARPYRLSDAESRAMFLARKEAGSQAKDLALEAGVSPTTMGNWLTKARKERAAA